ncbi:hypothetical protein IFR05_015814 [Cadophora sp. M221]|nr:hypothetical protein IFR05_015814 [Cadophora sp. M221]
MTAYESQQQAIMSKAQKHGIPTEELNKVFERKLELVAAEHGGRSVNWKLGRAEGMVWRHFFPGEPFPNAQVPAVKKEELKVKPAMAKQDSDGPPSPFPKALHVKSQSSYEEAARREWVHDRYQPASPKRDSYRPITEADSYRPQPLKENRLPARPVSGSGKSSTALVKKEGDMKERGPLKTLPNGSSGQVEQRAGSDPFLSSTTNDPSKPYRSLREIIQQKASTAGVPMDKITDCFEEKAAVAEKKFADRAGDWQIFFVEASVWGRFFTGPFPGTEPSLAPADQINSLDPKTTSKGTYEAPKSQVTLQSESASPPKRSPGVYSATVSERLMEDKAISQDKRRDFFQYLQKMRTYSRLEHKGEACAYIRGWFADNLTWQNFFRRDAFPFAQPRGKLNPNCAACLMLPNIAPLTSNNMNNVLKTQFANSKLHPAQQVRNTSPVIAAPANSFAIKTTGPPIAKPQARDDLNATIPPQRARVIPTQSIEPNTAPVQFWTEPQIPGDVSSFNRGHMFLTGWVTRVISFGMAKPSVHWNAIRTPFAAMQTQPVPTPPENAADAFSRLATYVQAAVTDKPTPPARDDSVTKEKGQLTKITPIAANSQAAASVPVASKPKSETITLSNSKILFQPVTDLSSFEDSEEQWQRYKIAFRTSDIDRLMMEETAKREGDLRMVLDKESRQIVSVAELVKRTVYRCSLSGQKCVAVSRAGGQSAADISMAGKKRKAGDDGGEEHVHDEKRSCL